MSKDEAKGQKRSLYMEVAAEADRPIAERRAVVVGRKGKQVVPRCYHLDGEKIAELGSGSASNGRFVSPFRRGGAYWGAIEALSLLGENHRHLFKDVKERMELLMSDDSLRDEKKKTPWEKFAGRESRNPKNARDIWTKILQNMEVLQRLGGNHPYGFKLAQLGACVNIYKASEAGEDGIYIELRTGIVGTPVPVNERRNRRLSRPINTVSAGTMVVTIETDEKVVEVVSVEEATKSA